MPGRLVLLATTHRVAPGLLSGEAWAALHAAGTVLVGAHDHPLLPALHSAGVPVRVVETPAGSTPPTVRAAALLAEAEVDGAVVVWVMSPDGDPGLADALAAAAAHEVPERTASLPEVELVTGSWDLPGARLLDLVAVMDRLRSPGGCPWDAKQTHESLVEYLVEEAYETVEAIETGLDDHLREELGDLLLQVVFHARIAEEHPEPWTVDDVADGIVAKLTARHPHVFGDVDAATAEQVEANWASLKAAEKGRESVTDGVPLALPGLVLASKILSRSRSVPVVLAAPEVVAAADVVVDAVDGQLGDLLLALVARCRDQGVDAEALLRESVRGFRARVRQAEGLAT